MAYVFSLLVFLIINGVFVFKSTAVVSKCPSVTQNLFPRKTFQYFTSYEYPTNYADDSNCKWTMNANTDEFINLEVIQMNLVNWAGQCSDNLTVYDGADTNAPIIHTYCGTDKSFSRSSGRILTLVFRSDSEMNDRGFQIKYWSHPVFDSSCNDKEGQVREIHVLNDLPMYLEFPDYKGLNVNNSDCRYRFVAPAGYMVGAEVITWQRTEALASGLFAIRSGYNTSGTIMVVSNTGTTPFSYLITADRYLWLHNKAAKKDWSRETAKVLLKFYTVPKFVNSCSDSLPTSLRSTTTPALVFYPFQKHSANNQSCPLKVTSHSADANVRLDLIRKRGVTDYSVLLCNSPDYVNVFDGETTSAVQLKQTCRRNSPSYISSNPSVVVDENPSFSTESYLLRAVSNDYPCNGKKKEIKVEENEEGVEDFFEKDKIPNNGHCSYLLKASKPNNVVSLSLTGDLGYLNVDSTCSKDYIIVYDGDTWTAPELGRWCGAPAVPFTSSGRHLLVVLVTDEHDNIGLKAQARFFGFAQGAVCPSVKVLTGAKEMKNITSPGFPSDYPLNSNCKWQISTRIYNFIVWFVVHESTLDDSCRDLVYVYDGLSTDHKDLLGRFCSKDTPTFKSTKSSMTIVFKSDNTKSFKGFKAGYYVEHVRGKNVTPGTPVGLIAGICIAIAVVGAFILVMYLACCRKSDYDEEKDQEELIE